MNQYTFLTTNELSMRIKYDARTIREQLKDSVLIEGIHYVRPFGGRKILYVWERIESEIMNGPSPESLISGLEEALWDRLMLETISSILIFVIWGSVAGKQHY